MSRPIYEPKQIYVGTGSLDTYSFDFKIEALLQLEVVVVNALDVEVQRVRGNDVTFLSTVTFDPALGGGEVVLLANLPAGYRMALLLANDAPTQIYEFSNKTDFTLKRMERAYDFIVGQVQRLAYRAQQTFRIHDMDDESNFNGQLPPGIQDPDNYNRTFALNSNGTGLVFGPTTDTINGAVAAAEAAAASEAAALLSQLNAGESADSAAVSEANTTFYANLFLFDDFIQVTEGNSPITNVNNGALYLADDTDGSIEFDLPDISLVDDNWKIAVIKQTSTPNVLDVVPFGVDTILGISTFQATQQGIGVVFFKLSPTNWGARYFAFTESTGINPLPPGGGVGAAFTKNSAVDLDTGWDDLVFSGFSSRFNTAWSSVGLRDTLEKILAITYIGPLIASFTGSSNSLREKGDTVSSITLSVNVTKRSNPIGRILFTQGATTILDDNPATNTGSGTTTAPYATPFSDNITFTVAVTDAIVGGDGPTTVTSTVTYSFVYPYYNGAGAPARTAAQVAAMTKSIINSSATLNKTFTTVAGDVYYYAYPASYGNLVSILDENGFETFSSWTKRVENITGLNATAVSYNIYESNNPVVAGSTNFTFKR